MVNRVILIGNLGKNPEVKNLGNDAKICKFSLATNENYMDKNGEWQTLTEWHNVVAWGGLVDRAEKLRKGQLVYVEGKVTYRAWEDQSGNKRNTTEIVANYFRSVSKNESSSRTPF